MSDTGILSDIKLSVRVHTRGRDCIECIITSRRHLQRLELPPVLHILLRNIVVRTDVVDVTIEATEISATTDTESQDVDIRVTILQVLEKNSSHGLIILTHVIRELFVSATEFTITQSRDTTATTTTETINTIRILIIVGKITTLTISQDDTIHLLEFVIVLELRDDGVKCHDALIQRCARQTQTLRRIVIAVILESISTTEQIQTLLLKLLSIGAGTEHIQQTEMLVNVKNTCLLYCLLRQTLRSIIVTINEHRMPLVSESINLKGNLYFLTEPRQVHQLLNSVKDNITHRTRPVQHEDHAVVLTIRQHGNFLEQIVVVLVSMK